MFGPGEYVAEQTEGIIPIGINRVNSKTNVKCKIYCSKFDYLSFSFSQIV